MGKKYFKRGGEFFLRKYTPNCPRHDDKFEECMLNLISSSSSVYLLPREPRTHVANHLR